jgi:O-antigen ligase
MTAAVLLLVVWGALAFGAVYPWAYTPLLAGCAAVGIAGIVSNRSRVFTGNSRAALFPLLVTAGAVMLQLVPLPSTVIAAVSPSADNFLANYDLNYALGSSGGSPDGRVWHPLSLVPRDTALSLTFLIVFTIFLAGLTAALSRTRVRRVGIAIVAFGAVLALIGIIQKAALGDHAWVGMKIYGFWSPANLMSTPFGPYVNKNHFAGWMLMGLPLALGVALGLAEQARRTVRGWRSAVLWLSTPDGGRFQMMLLAVLLMAASLLMTKSRSGVAGLIAAAVILSVTAGRRFGSARAGLAALVSVGALLLIVFTLAGGDFAARISNQMDGTTLRKSIWSDSATIVRDFPVAGTGLNTFGTAMIRYQTTQNDQHFQEAHNDYLQVLVEGGMLVAIPALAAFLLIARAVYRRFSAHDDEPLMYWIRAGATTGLVAILAQALVEFSLQMPGNAVMAVVLLAIALHEPSPHSRQRTAERTAA